MDLTQELPSIHFRRRWFYVLWVLLLAGAAGFLGWWETPSREGPARLTLLLKGPDLPPGTKGALWTGPSSSWKADWNPGEAWFPLKGNSLALGPRELRIAHRRLGQGLLMRRTHDLAIAVLQAPSKERRYLVYDLREDLATLLSIGLYLSVEVPCSWERMPRVAAIPPDSKRRAVGH